MEQLLLIGDLSSYTSFKQVDTSQQQDVPKIQKFWCTSGWHPWWLQCSMCSWKMFCYVFWIIAGWCWILSGAVVTLSGWQKFLDHLLSSIDCVGSGWLFGITTLKAIEIYKWKSYKYKRNWTVFYFLILKTNDRQVLWGYGMAVEVPVDI